MDRNKLLSSIPKVDDILKNRSITSLMQKAPRTLVIEAVRETLNEIRGKILKVPEEELESSLINIDEILMGVDKRVQAGSQRHLRRVINCTGVVIHTNLGRSILCREAVEAAADTAQNYSNLEYDLGSGERGSRYSHVEDILVRITGAESAMVVNNNAAAVLLVLSTLCRGREAVVSRGELVEVGGSFRIPEVMEQSGARLVEVGATNRTHLYDYENAINENTGILLKVHTSNYRIMGFTAAVSGRELTALGTKHGIPVIEDIGSGNFIDMTKYGISYEPTVQEAVDAGIDIVTFSGDKMLGGPQAGIIAGRKQYISMMKKNPLARAIRIDKMTLAALEATMKQYIEEDIAVRNIPTLKMITESKDDIKARAQSLLCILRDALKGKADLKMVEEYSQIGGGSMPLEDLPTYAISIKPRYISVTQLEERLRKAPVPVIVRTRNDSILIDLRTVAEDEYSCIVDTISEILQEGSI